MVVEQRCLNNLKS